MLTGIQIQNYLFVPHQRLEFGPGMTVLSGETGAGKSILVGAISLIFGDSSPGLEAFDPALPIYLEASFDIRQNAELQEYLSQQGQEIEGELILARELTPAGRSAYFMNGRRVTAAMMRELKPLMIDFHHQRDQQRLLSASHQLQLLDLHAQNQALKTDFANRYGSLRAQIKELESLEEQAERERQLQELYQFQFDELEKAGLREGEELQLQQEFELLNHAQEIAETATTASFDLYEGENSVYARISGSLAGISKFSHLNKGLATVEQALQDCQELISENAAALSELTQKLDSNPNRLEDIQQRLDQINSLLYKHKLNSSRELLELQSQRETQLNSFADLGQSIESLKLSIKQDFEHLKQSADKLSESREKAASQLSEELRENISQLSLPDARFKICIDRKSKGKNIIQDYLDSCTELGQDSCQFFFSANRGGQLKPLSAVASGGELSRILLAIKKVLSQGMDEKLMILDEIDAGIGGKTAENVAQFIFQLARRHRIICITHLAQIAAIADCQIALKKESDGPKSVIKMNVLTPEQRLEELARMLSGDLSSVSLQHARELINKYKT